MEEPGMKHDTDIVRELLNIIKKDTWMLPVLLAILALLVIQLAVRTNLVHRFVSTLLRTFVGTDLLAPKTDKEDEVKGEETEASPGHNKELAFQKKMKLKSNRIIKEAESGEMKETVERCKRFLGSIQASSFACKIFVNSWKKIEGVEKFGEIVENIGDILELPKKDIRGIKLSASGEESKRDYLAFDCAMQDAGKVRLHTGGYQVTKHSTEDGDRFDFQIVLNYMDMSKIAFRKLPESAVQDLETKWFKRSPAIECDKPNEGEDWISYFQYKAHKNILKELNEE